MELLQPTTATVIASYDHPVWGKYASITRNGYGKGEVTYVGFMPSDALIGAILAQAVERAKVTRLGADFHFPLIVRGGVNARHKAVHYLLNYSAGSRALEYPFGAGADLLSGKSIGKGDRIELGPWGIAIVEESTPNPQK